MGVKYQLGDIVVTTTERKGRYKPKIGEIFKITGEDPKKGFLYYNVHENAVSDNRVRFATTSEIEAFISGIRYISDIISIKSYELWD